MSFWDRLDKLTDAVFNLIGYRAAVTRLVGGRARSVAPPEE